MFSVDAREFDDPSPDQASSGDTPDDCDHSSGPGQ